MNIIHIHSYSNFINDTNNFFDNSRFNNTIIFIGNDNVNRISESENILFFEVSPGNLKKIISKCNESDLVVLYNLDITKSYIANRISLNVKIIWRFFGMELYGKMSGYVYSDLTLKLVEKSKLEKTKIHNIWDSRIRPVLSKIKWRTNFKKEFEKAVRRIDYFLGLSETEYHFLKKYWSDLPLFLQIPFTFLNKKNIKTKLKTNKVIIGNNRSAYNNHLDTLKLIKMNNMTKYSFDMIFNYGINNIYSKKVRKEAIEMDNVNVIEEFMTFDKYQKFFISMDAFVLNGYRQMAMRAVFESLTSGVKVYLNKKNIILQWLKEEGFLIFNMKDFSNDMDNDNLSLSKKQAEHNTNQFNRFRSKYNVEDFQNKISELKN